MRLFVALDLTEEIHQSLRQLLGALQAAGADVRWVRPEGMHLTLKFVGEVKEAKRPRIEESLRALPVPGPVALRFRGLGYFPNERRPRVLWVGVETNPSLTPLAGAMEAALEPLGIRREGREYTPHLTLGRFKSNKGLARLQERIAALPAQEFGEMEARAFYLYQSRLSPGGAQYSKLAEFALSKPTGR